MKRELLLDSLSKIDEHIRFLESPDNTATPLDVSAEINELISQLKKSTWEDEAVAARRAYENFVLLCGTFFCHGKWDELTDYQRLCWREIVSA